MQRSFDIQQFLTQALAEDVGAGDLTSEAILPPTVNTRFAMNARQDLVACGVTFLPILFGLIDKSVKVTVKAQEGEEVKAGATLATLEGAARSLLLGERVALNLVQHLSAVSTMTKRYVDAVEGTGAQIVDTRKTIPGLRVLQKYAVRNGGGYNHRFGLYDGVLIKDNHIAVVGKIHMAVMAAKQSIPMLNRIEVECDTLEQVGEAIAAGADMVLLDNMDLKTLKEAVERCRGKGIRTEASGNVNLETVRGIAETGVDVISVGRLTHSVTAVDIGMDKI